MTSWGVQHDRLFHLPRTITMDISDQVMLSPLRPVLMSVPPLRSFIGHLDRWWWTSDRDHRNHGLPSGHRPSSPERSCTAFSLRRETNAPTIEIPPAMETAIATEYDSSPDSGPPAMAL